MGDGPSATSQQSGSTSPTVPGASSTFVRMVAWLLRTQAGLVTGIALFAVLLGSPRAGFGILAGGGIGLVLTAVAAVRTVMVPADAGVAAMVGAFYRAMALKLAAAVVLFVAVARWFAGDFGPVLIGYVVTLAAYWLAMWRLAHIGRE